MNKSFLLTLFMSMAMPMMAMAAEAEEPSAVTQDYEAQSMAVLKGCSDMSADAIMQVFEDRIDSALDKMVEEKNKDRRRQLADSIKIYERVIDLASAAQTEDLEAKLKAAELPERKWLVDDISVFSIPADADTANLHTAVRNFAVAAMEVKAFADNLAANRKAIDDIVKNFPQENRREFLEKSTVFSDINASISSMFDRRKKIRASLPLFSEPQQAYINTLLDDYMDLVNLYFK